MTSLELTKSMFQLQMAARNLGINYRGLEMENLRRKIFNKLKPTTNLWYTKNKSNKINGPFTSSHINSLSNKRKLKIAKAVRSGNTISIPNSSNFKNYSEYENNIQRNISKGPEVYFISGHGETVNNSPIKKTGKNQVVLFTGLCGAWGLSSNNQLTLKLLKNQKSYKIKTYIEDGIKNKNLRPSIEHELKKLGYVEVVWPYEIYYDVLYSGTQPTNTVPQIGLARAMTSGHRTPNTLNRPLSENYNTSLRKYLGKSNNITMSNILQKSGPGIYISSSCRRVKTQNKRFNLPSIKEIDGKKYIRFRRSNSSKNKWWGSNGHSANTGQFLILNNSGTQLKMPIEAYIINKNNTVTKQNLNSKVGNNTINNLTIQKSVINQIRLLQKRKRNMYLQIAQKIKNKIPLNKEDLKFVSIWGPVGIFGIEMALRYLT
jgi:hypothetical protein